MENYSHFGIKILQVLLVPIVRWSVRLGIGHRELSLALKPLFFQATQSELTLKGIKCTESALSLASGLHRGDVSVFLSQTSGADPDLDASVNRINPGSQVVARWIAQALPRQIPFRGGPKSFTGLVRACHQDGGPLLSAKLLLQDLGRRGLVTHRAEHVELVSEVGLPSADAQEKVMHFVGAVRDHIEACLYNLEVDPSASFLEQSLQVDGLYPISVERLHTLSREWWLKALQELGQEAIVLSERDEPMGGSQRLRLGVYFYTPEPPSSSSVSTRV